MLKKFVIRLFIFGIPFYLIIIINLIIDPFNYNSSIDLGMNKKLISYKMNYRLYDILEYKRQRIPNILFGDSRMAAISTDEITKVSGEEYYNFAFGSASLPECFDAFWYVAGLTKLKKVYFAIPFNLFSGINSKNIFAQARNIASSPFDYYLNLFIFKASCYNALYKIFRINAAAETPNMTQTEFWDIQLLTASISYRSFSWPNDFIDELLRIKKYCLENHIKMTIIIPPTHLDLQKLVHTHNLKNEYDEYKRCLRSIAKVIDYDVASEITMNKANFKDPYHFNIKTMKRIVQEIWKIDKPIHSTNHH